MAMWIGINRKARVCYGFDDISLVPGNITINPEDVDISTEIGGIKFDTPVLAAAMDGVCDTRFAIEIGKLGGIGVLNLMGIYTRYEDPYSVIEKIISSPHQEATALIQSIYREPVKEKLIAQRVEEIKKGNVVCAVSCIPQYAERFLGICQEAGVDIFVVQSTVTTARHISSSYKALDLTALCRSAKVPIIVGNCVTFDVAIELRFDFQDGTQTIYGFELGSERGDKYRIKAEWCETNRPDGTSDGFAVCEGRPTRLPQMLPPRLPKLKHVKYLLFPFLGNTIAPQAWNFLRSMMFCHPLPYAIRSYAYITPIVPSPLLESGENLPSVLRKLEKNYPESFNEICKNLRLLVP
ncbi:MAG: IMP dehydrogenase, partial [Candidatus Omnitrophica bacterium]|nr:IMP dehydrogenase [Candidatus Omnitrophota bacterium]